jgi:hypothetical protein
MVVTDELVEFEKYLVDQSFKRDLWNIPQINWQKPKDFNVQLAGLENTTLNMLISVGNTNSQRKR